MRFVADEELGVGDPGFAGRNDRRAEVAEHDTAFRQQNLLGSAQHLQSLGINLCDKNWCAVPHDVVVVRSASSVRQEQPATVTEPMRLCVVAPQILVIIKRPFPDRLEVQSVIARGHKGGGIVPQSDVILVPKSCQRWFVKATSPWRGQFVTAREVFEFLPVE